jgi:hypothetical protein
MVSGASFPHGFGSSRLARDNAACSPSAPAARAAGPRPKASVSRPRSARTETVADLTELVREWAPLDVADDDDDDRDTLPSPSVPSHLD